MFKENEKHSKVETKQQQCGNNVKMRQDHVKTSMTYGRIALK